MRLIPAGDSGDLVRLGKSVQKMQQMGSKVAEIEHHTLSNEIYETMEMMRKMGSLITGMSSVGPAIAALVPDGGEMADELSEQGYRVLRTNPYSHGLSIRVE